MSDALPPPPDDLRPPPGYVAYQPSPMSSAPLRRINSQSRALVILLGIYAAVGVVAVLLSLSIVGSARDYLDGTISEDQLTDDLAPVLGVGLVQLGLTIAIVVMTMVWMFRIASNHRALGRHTTWSPGWAIAAWFVPPFLFVIPFLVLMEMWKAAEPTSPPGDDGWRRAPVSPAVPVWWVLYGPIALLLMLFGTNPFRGFGGDVDDTAERLADSQGAAIAQAAVNIAAAVAFLLVVRGLHARHSRLTGEASAR